MRCRSPWDVPVNPLLLQTYAQPCKALSLLSAVPPQMVVDSAVQHIAYTKFCDFSNNRPEGFQILDVQSPSHWDSWGTGFFDPGSNRRMAAVDLKIIGGKKPSTQPPRISVLTNRAVRQAGKESQETGFPRPRGCSSSRDCAPLTDREAVTRQWFAGDAAAFSHAERQADTRGWGSLLNVVDAMRSWEPAKIASMQMSGASPVAFPPQCNFCGGVSRPYDCPTPPPGRVADWFLGVAQEPNGG